ncbi:MAG: hypothetical protein JXR84_04205 [Anaerolineae bacterium]|nr:hypothetical protein [Anaerolineae bacterium]
MGDIAKTAANVRPLGGAIVRRGTLKSASIAPGDAVYLDGTNGWELADADAEASAQARGVVVGLPDGAVTSVAGDVADIVVHGPVEGYASMTPGGAAFVSTTAGAIDQTAPATAGDYPFAIGWAESATVLFVNPQATVPVVNGS